MDCKCFHVFQVKEKAINYTVIRAIDLYLVTFDVRPLKENSFQYVF